MQERAEIADYWGRLRGTLGGAVGFALDRVLPPRCYACGTGVEAQGALCAACWSGLAFITDPQCGRCGLPFEYALEGTSICGACLARPPAFDVARSALHYDDASRPFILAFKHGDETRHARPFAKWMLRTLNGVMRDDMLIIPVPLHRKRLLKRRYNQAAMLARELARLGELPCEMEVLHRIKATPSQGGLSAQGRRSNVQGAFALSPKGAKVLNGRSVLLVDDVFTTGATVNACAKVLRKGGAAFVAVVTLARVVRPVNPTI